jgi:hypothetical protein
MPTSQDTNGVSAAERETQQNRAWKRGSAMDPGAVTVDDDEEQSDRHVLGPTAQPAIVHAKISPSYVDLQGIAGQVKDQTQVVGLRSARDHPARDANHQATGKPQSE